MLANWPEATFTRLLLSHTLVRPPRTYSRLNGGAEGGKAEEAEEEQIRFQDEYVLVRAEAAVHF